MQNIFIEFLPPWVETGLQPAFYDKESGTVLQQTARMYAKMNELIGNVNKFEKDTKDVVDEYIAKFVELHDYVYDYFDNLDVQEEINNKLDAMVEAGTLQEIITTYIQSNVAWTFDTVADMKLADNLVAGSYARTLGFRSVNDGGGATYYITNTGTANEMDVIAIGNLFANFVKPLVVAPEMFGAYGDGTHDDTNAWNKAVSVGRNVKAFEKTYLVSTIEVTDDIDIDCGNASFISSATRVFIIQGELLTSLANENNYSADDIDYSISNTDYTSYTGFAFVHGDNNFELSRDYYKGGFACTFDNGKICASYPIPVENTVIDIINPIRGSLKNIKNLTHQSVTNANRSILIEYAEGYVIENINGKNLQSYIDIDISKSINVTCRNLNITHNVTFDDNVSYIVYIEDSSFCNVKDSYFYNKKWHSWTTSGIYLCYKNSVTDSTLLCDSQYAIYDHPNALGTTLDNLTASCVGVCGLAYVNNIKIVSLKDSQKRCLVSLEATSIEKNAKYVVSNIYLNIDSNANGTYCGVWLNASPTSSGNSYYYNDVVLENISHNKAVICRFYYNLPSSSTYIIGKIKARNCWLDVYFPTTSQAHITVTNSEFYLDQFNEYVVSKKADIGNTSGHINKLSITNSDIRQIVGTVTTVVANNLNMSGTSDNLSVTNLYGCNLLSRFDFAVIKAATIVNIASMQYNTGAQNFNFVKANGTVYYQQVNTSTGLFETKTIA